MNSNDALTKAFGGGPWTLHVSRGNDVYVDPTRVAKVARPHPRGLRNLENGVESAFLFHDYGAPVVLPLLDYVEETDIGPASLWPLIENVNASAFDLSEAHAHSLGRALAPIATYDFGDLTPWDPFVYVPYRLESSTFPWSVVRRTQRLYEFVNPMVESIMDADSYVMAHGDAATSNTLCLSDGSILLIDLDQASGRPRDWDAASLYVDLVLQGGNRPAFESLIGGYGDVDETATGKIALVKATLTTTFGLTLEPTIERIHAMKTRLDQMFDWLHGVEPEWLIPVE